MPPIRDCLRNMQLGPLEPPLPTPQCREQLQRIYDSFSRNVISQTEAPIEALDSCIHQWLRGKGPSFIPHPAQDEVAFILNKYTIQKTDDELASVLGQYSGNQLDDDDVYERKLFVAQLSPHITLQMLAYIMIGLMKEHGIVWEPVYIRQLGHRGGFSGCAWVYCKTSEEKQKLVEVLDQSFFCDKTGVWIAKTDEDKRAFDSYKVTLKELDKRRLSQEQIPRVGIVVEIPMRDRDLRSTESPYQLPNWKWRRTTLGQWA